MKIFLDLDGVLHNFSDQLFKSLLLHPKDILLMKQGVKLDYYFLANFLGKELHDNTVINGGEDFWYNIDLLPWANQLYNLCVELVGLDNVYFLSSYGKFHAAATPKAVNIKKQFNSEQLILTAYKELLAKLAQ